MWFNNPVDALEHVLAQHCVVDAVIPFLHVSSLLDVLVGFGNELIDCLVLLLHLLKESCQFLLVGSTLLLELLCKLIADLGLEEERCDSALLLKFTLNEDLLIDFFLRGCSILKLAT